MKQKLQKACALLLTVVAGIVGGMALVVLLAWIDEREHTKGR